MTERFHYKMTPAGLLDAIDRGLTKAQIATEFSLSRQAVHQRVKAAGLTDRALENARLTVVRKKGESKALTAYKRQQLTARRRGIPWEFTFEQWWDVWEKSGKWDQRGRGQGAYVMARRGDTGPYAAWNVFICTHSQNGLDAEKNLARAQDGKFLPLTAVTT